MNLLMTVEVYQRQIVISIPTAALFRDFVVNLQFLAVEERFTAIYTASLLPFGKLPSTGFEVTRSRTVPFGPVSFQLGVIRRCLSPHQNVSLNRKPPEFQNVHPRLFVAKDPVITPFRIEPSEVTGLHPSCRLLRVVTSGITGFPTKHPVVELLENFTGNCDTEIIRPTTNDRVEFFDC